MITITELEISSADIGDGWSVKVNGKAIVDNVSRDIAAMIYHRLSELDDNIKPKLNHFQQLRLWHWQQRGLYRTLAASERGIAKVSLNAAIADLHEQKAKDYDAQASTHLGAVQTLNDAPGCTGTTAEQDEADAQPTTR